MKTSSPAPLLAFACVALALGGCSKTPEGDASSPPTAATAAPPPAATPTVPADPDLERKRAKLEYATMEDAYLNDPKAQWASAATVSSWYGQRNGSPPDDNFAGAQNLVGAPNGSQWRNDNQDLGFDHFEVTFAKPVHATEFRAVFQDGAGAVSKVEVKDAAGTYTTVWSGLNEDPSEVRGPRTWFTRKFAKTAAPVNAVKVTLANTVAQGYKVVEAAQLVGE
jgi:hypothetical protein